MREEQRALIRPNQEIVSKSTLVASSTAEDLWNTVFLCERFRLCLVSCRYGGDHEFRVTLSRNYNRKRSYCCSSKNTAAKDAIGGFGSRGWVGTLLSQEQRSEQYC